MICIILSTINELFMYFLKKELNDEKKSTRELWLQGEPGNPGHSSGTRRWIIQRSRPSLESVRVRRFGLRQENKCLCFRGILVSRVELVKKAVRAPPPPTRWDGVPVEHLVEGWGARAQCAGRFSVGG